MSITSKLSPLSLYAGSKALSHIKEFGLSPTDVRVIAGAAGGPKWLVLHGLDKYLFGDWLADVKKPIHLIGSSIGAWRYASYCRKDFQAGFDAFEKLYFAQTYSQKADKTEINNEIEKILDGIFDPSSIQEILENPRFKLNLFTDRCRGLLRFDQPLLLFLGLSLCTACNLISRRSLSLFFKRTLFYNPTTSPPFINMADFPTDKVVLNAGNLRLSVLASGAIPLVMKGVRDIPGAIPGVYRDGGLVDYHMSLPYGVDKGIILLPHFSKTVLPGWLDKFAGWRNPDRKFMENVLLLAPSESFIESLPLSKIPDRSDFKRFINDDNARMKYWKEVTKRSVELPEALQSWMDKESLIDHIKPFD